MSTYTNVPKPTGRPYTRVNPVGLEIYDESNFTYDSTNLLYDGGDGTSYTTVPKPVGRPYTNVPKPIS